MNGILPNNRGNCLTLTCSRLHFILAWNIGYIEYIYNTYALLRPVSWNRVRILVLMCFAIAKDTTSGHEEVVDCESDIIADDVIIIIIIEYCINIQLTQAIQQTIDITDQYNQYNRYTCAICLISQLYLRHSA